MYTDYRCICSFHLYIVILEGKLFICFDFLYFLFCICSICTGDFLTHTQSQIKNHSDAALKLKEMSPKPMDSMFEKQTKAEALKKRADRREMVILDGPPTTPGIYFIHFLPYVQCHTHACQFTVLIYVASWCSILFQFKMIFFMLIVGYCQTVEIK